MGISVAKHLLVPPWGPSFLVTLPLIFCRWWAQFSSLRNRRFVHLANKFDWFVLVPMCLCKEKLEVGRITHFLPPPIWGHHFQRATVARWRDIFQILGYHLKDKEIVFPLIPHGSLSVKRFGHSQRFVKVSEVFLKVTFCCLAPKTDF